MNVQKNETFEIVIEDMTTQGEGIGKFQGFPFFVKDAMIGDRVKIKVIKAKKNYAYGRLEKIICPSKDRVEARCSVARACGGCSLQHMSYEAQLHHKYKKVKDCLERIGGVKQVETLMKPIVGMFTKEEAERLDDNLISATICEQGAWHYRNKAQFPVGTNKDGEIVTGFYAGRTHSIIDQDYCYLQQEVTADICERVKAFAKEYHVAPYDEQTHTGILRHILIRSGFTSGEVMVCLIIHADTLPYEAELVEYLQDIPGITSISYNVNQDKTNRIMGDKTVTIWGEDTITDYIGNVKYQISARSFYQVNPVQTKVLYEKALEYAALTGKETVWDLYCGIGTISLFLAQKAKQVYGVEIVPEAIEDAKKNAALNGFDNTTFYVGKAEEVLPKWVEEHANHSGHQDGTTTASEVDGLHPDVIVVDPPRKGCDAKCLSTMVQMQPKRIVYVSCDPATLARDVKWLQENGYELKEVTPVDQFAHSNHVECVTMLQRRDM